MFGHLLSGQLSAWLLPQQADDPAAKQLFAAWIDLLRRQGCGCSSEFGIGALKRPLLEQLEPEKAAAAYQLKQAIDPTMRLNPGLFAFSKGE